MRLFIFAVAVLFAVPAHATMMLEISGTPGSGETTWVFSGSDTARGTEQFNAGTIGAGGSWQDVGDYVTSAYDNAGISLISGIVTIQVNGSASNTIDRIRLDHDEPPALDELGFGFPTLSSDLPFTNGDVVSWAGTAVVPVDLNDLVPGEFGSSAFGTIGTDILTLEGCVLTAGGECPASVPEPSTGLLLVTGGLLAIASRRLPRPGRRLTHPL